MPKPQLPRRLARLAARVIEQLHERLPDGAEVTVIVRHGSHVVHLRTGCLGCESVKLRLLAAEIERQVLESN